MTAHPAYTKAYFTRRSFTGLATTFLATTALAACSGTTPAQIAATLANAQAEASAIYTAVKGFVPATLTAPIQTALSAAQTAVTAFQAVKPGQSGLQAGEAVVNALVPLLTLIPIPGVSSPAIIAGLGLVEAFANGIAAVATPAPSAAVGAEPVVVIPAPIPIPVPVA